MDTNHRAPSAELPLGLTRDAKHRYTWNPGDAPVGPLPSVTTVLGVLDKSPALVGWAKRETAACAVRNLDTLAQMRLSGGPDAAIAWLKAIPDYQRVTAANVGTRVHALAEQLARGLDPGFTSEEAPYVRAYRGFLTEHKPRFLAVEEMVCSLRHGYAGTLDAVAVIDGEVWLLDIKSGAGVYPEAGPQLAAYAAADFVGRPGTEMRYRLPKPERFGIVHVRPDVARLIECRVDDGTLAAFLDAKRLYEWRHGPAKSVIGDVIQGKEATAA